MIRCVVDDLAFVDADAVLRPANDRLEPITPAAVRMDRHAGPGFAAACRSAVALDAGSAVITPAGDLPASFVLHVVLQDEQTTASADTVRRALAAAWRRAAEWGLAHVAAPVVGAGPGLLELEEAVALMARTLHEAPEPRPQVTLIVERQGDSDLIDAVLRSAAS